MNDKDLVTSVSYTQSSSLRRVSTMSSAFKCARTYSYVSVTTVRQLSEKMILNQELCQIKVLQVTHRRVSMSRLLHLHWQLAHTCCCTSAGLSWLLRTCAWAPCSSSTSGSRTSIRTLVSIILTCSRSLWKGNSGGGKLIRLLKLTNLLVTLIKVSHEYPYKIFSSNSLLCVIDDFLNHKRIIDLRTTN